MPPRVTLLSLSHPGPSVSALSYRISRFFGSTLLCSMNHQLINMSHSHTLWIKQRVTTMASSAMSGTFQLAFNGETTPLVNAAASAEELRSAVEALDSITTAAVGVGVDRQQLCP